LIGSLFYPGFRVAVRRFIASPFVRATTPILITRAETQNPAGLPSIPINETPTVSFHATFALVSPSIQRGWAASSTSCREASPSNAPTAAGRRLQLQFSSEPDYRGGLARKRTSPNRCIAGSPS
jgi:hypothetical protein